MEEIVLSLLAFCCTITGNLLINNRRRLGFVIWSIGDVLWIIIEFVCGINWFRFMMFFTYIIVNVDGYLKWKKVKVR